MKERDDLEGAGVSEIVPLVGELVTALRAKTCTVPLSLETASQSEVGENAKL